MCDWAADLAFILAFAPPAFLALHPQLLETLAAAASQAVVLSSGQLPYVASRLPYLLVTCGGNAQAVVAAMEAGLLDQALRTCCNAPADQVGGTSMQWWWLCNVAWAMPGSWLLRCTRAVAPILAERVKRTGM